MLTKKEFNRRELRGLAIVAKGGMIKQLDEGAYLVRSSDLEWWYKVSWNGKDWNCECMDFWKLRRPCKHIYAILFLSRLPFMLMVNFQANEIRCPRCSSDKIVRKGLVHNKAFAAQRYMCKKCLHKFTDNAESKGLKGNPLAVVAAADLYFKGVSLRMIEDHLNRIYSLKVSYPTIHRWIRRFIESMKTMEKEHVSEVGGTWHVDETEVKIASKRYYLWNVLDEESRILLASVITYGRSSKEAEIVLRKALKTARTWPKKIVTDGLASYQVAMRNVFGCQTEHIFKARFTDPQNNNLVETFDGKWKKLWDKRIRSKSVLRKNLLKSAIFPPRNVYYSVLKWLDPKSLGSSKVRNYCLGGPLIFDVDVKSSEIYGDQTIEKGKEAISSLEEFLSETYSFNNFAYTFSGKKGFHLYVKDFDPLNFGKDYSQLDREYIEKEVRTIIAKKVLKKGFTIDAQVTLDTRRIVRLPNTLHGGSGFLSVYLNSRNELEKFDLSKSIVFPSNISIKIKLVKKTPRISIDNLEVNLDDSKREVEVPMSVAILLLLSGYAVIAH